MRIARKYSDKEIGILTRHLLDLLINVKLCEAVE